MLAALRLLVLRREHEAIPLAVLLMATVQYVVFRQGADIHVFWPHYFAAFFALGMGAIVATLAPLFALVPRLRQRRRAPVLALGCALLPVLAIARDGIPALRYARDTGGRFNEKGLLIHSDGAKTAFLRFVDPSIPRNAVIAMPDGMKATWSQVWTLGGRVLADHHNLPGKSRNTVWLGDTRFLGADAQGTLARDTHVTAVGPFWKVVEGEPAAPLDAFSFVEREPSWWEWYFVSGTEPHRDVTPDPWLTWELRTHLGQPAEPPAAPPVTLEQRRIAHNIAVAAGDTARAAALFAEIRARALARTRGVRRRERDRRHHLPRGGAAAADHPDPRGRPDAARRPALGQVARDRPGGVVDHHGRSRRARGGRADGAPAAAVEEGVSLQRSGGHPEAAGHRDFPRELPRGGAQAGGWGARGGGADAAVTG